MCIRGPSVAPLWDRVCSTNGTLSVMRPSARKGTNSRGSRFVLRGVSLVSELPSARPRGAFSPRESRRHFGPSSCNQNAFHRFRRGWASPATNASKRTARECQSLDWKTHKAFCKAIKSVEKEPMVTMGLLFSLADAPTTDLNALHNMVEAHASNIQGAVQRSLKRELTIPERNLVGWEPRCMGCTRTDQLIRIEFATKSKASGGASTSAQATKPRQLTPCPECNVSFCCSQEHWVAARALHHAPCPDSPGQQEDMLSQCEINRLARGDAMLEAALAESHDNSGIFRWAPARIKQKWESVVVNESRGKEKGSRTRWEEEIAEEMRSSVNVPSERPMGPWVRMASDALAMPMTILWGLEVLNGSNKDWTKKHTLTVHLLGATTTELVAGMIFEEILHRLPEIVSHGPVPRMQAPRKKTRSRTYGRHVPRLRLCPGLAVRKTRSRHRLQLWRQLRPAIAQQVAPDLEVARGETDPEPLYRVQQRGGTRRRDAPAFRRRSALYRGDEEPVGEREADPGAGEGLWVLRDEWVDCGGVLKLCVF
uniref:Mitochondrial splicing suppressor 51-like C-terminal domain-containing protein n=1 Tax=Mycena chlorophos TaxID=658473 RepID=A0ABQ0MB50_MYCCL|nr:predicted protein [Mycena chlorophos]